MKQNEREFQFVTEKGGGQAHVICCNPVVWEELESRGIQSQAADQTTESVALFSVLWRRVQCSYNTAEERLF